MKKFLLFLLLALALPHVSDAASNQIRYTFYMGHRFVYLRDVANYYGCNYYVQGKLCTISNQNVTMTFNYGRRDGTINKTSVHYLFVPLFQGNDVFVSEQDFLLLIDAIVRRNAVPSHRLKTIVIDPGHGAHDNGGSGSRYREKDLTLQIGTRLRNILASRGYTVYMTRNKDVFIPLENRVDFAKRCGADLFISVHANISADPGTDGIETFCVTPAGAPSTNDIKQHTGARERGNYFDLNNSKFAYEVHRSVIGSTRASDRGVKHARFLVVKNAPCPAILVETGFLSNRREESRLADPNYQNALATGIANGVINYQNALRRR